jgi:hypothetical protein
MKLVAMQETPFVNTFWLDTDTHVIADISPIFEIDCDFAIARENVPKLVLNAGIYLVKGDAGREFVNEWWEAWRLTKGNRFDQQVLPQLLRHNPDLRFHELPWYVWNVRPHDINFKRVPLVLQAETKILHTRWGMENWGQE